MAKLLATDLDGTLMYPKKFSRCIPKKNVKFLRKWVDSGNKLVLITSRGPAYMERLKKEIDRDFDYITYTSSYIVANGEVIRDKSIPYKTAKRLLDKIYERFHPNAYLMDAKGYPTAIRNNNGVPMFLVYLYKVYWWFQGKRREPWIYGNKEFDEILSKANVYKVMIFNGLRKKANSIMSKEINKGIREEFPEIECSWSSVINEITPRNCNKGAGLTFYCDFLKIKPEDVIVVGDSGNDISMFNLFHENSYCMAKASPSVKKYAAHTISRVYKLDKLVLEKGE